MSEFADYVEKQQSLRYPSSAGPSITDEDRAELNDLLNTLDLEDNVPQVPLKDLLLGDGEDAFNKLVELLTLRIDEGHGETVFEIGFENNGDTMSLTLLEWDAAMARLVEAAKKVRSDCQVLLTKNVGGEVEAESMIESDEEAAAEEDEKKGKEKTQKGKEKGKEKKEKEKDKDKDPSCSGKILIRQHPASVEEVIETRIAVVGNVDAGKSTMLGVLVKGGLDDGRGKARVKYVLAVSKSTIY